MWPVTMTWRRLAVVVVAALCAAGARPPQAPLDLPKLDLTIGPSTRLLVVAPHPDDETLAAGGVIHRVVSSGGSVRVVWLTSGDAFAEGVETKNKIKDPRPRDYRSYGTLREGEARNALTMLGLDRKALTFLGFPDDGLCLLASKYLSAKKRAFESPYTDRFSPPLTEQMIRGVRYRGDDVRRELERILREFEPTVIVYSHPEDEHPDHCAAHIFVREALMAVARWQPRPRELMYLVHYSQWPVSEDAGTGSELHPPAEFPPGEGGWANFALQPDEIELKKRALLAYSSQMLVIGRFMLAFGRSNELFLEGEPASVPECWCDGENVATELPASQYRRRPRRR
jgi:LmbE family N-acetylglucosaminyl deacetylase